MRGTVTVQEVQWPLLPQGPRVKPWYGPDAPEVPESIDPDVAGTSPVKERDVGMSAARLLPVGDTDESLGTGTSTWYSLWAMGN